MRNCAEKICQQWIVNEANARQKSDWYYVDLDYTMELFAEDIIKSW